MTENHSNDTAPVAEQVRDAVSSAPDIRAEVERITRAALGEGRVEVKQLGDVIQAVGEGIRDGASASPDTGRTAVAEALEGLQAALGHSAMRVKLAIEESMDRVESFSTDELKTELRRLAALEKMMLETLQRVASAGTSSGARALGDLVGHARRTGTQLGSDVETALQSLAANLPTAARETTLAALGALRETGARAAEAASGALDGLAEGLREASKRKTPDEE